MQAFLSPVVIHYKYRIFLHNKQKKPRDKSFITEHEIVKNFIRFAKMIKSQFESGKGSGYGALDEFGEFAYDFFRVFVHIVFDPIKHQPYKNI